MIQPKDSIERLLYGDPPTGFPDDSLSVRVAFEVGGAYETWGWLVERKEYDSAKKEYYTVTVACHKYLDECLKLARAAIKKRLSETTQQGVKDGN